MIQGLVLSVFLTSLAKHQLVYKKIKGKKLMLLFLSSPQAKIFSPAACPFLNNV